jgi:hypothetical protein
MNAALKRVEHGNPERFESRANKLRKRLEEVQDVKRWRGSLVTMR